jgi:hypothetical protein
MVVHTWTVAKQPLLPWAHSQIRVTRAADSAPRSRSSPEAASIRALHSAALKNLSTASTGGSIFKTLAGA